MWKPLITYNSSTDSSSSQFNSFITTTPSLSTSSSPFTRCTGLNLLVKAIHQITAGSVIGVPYFQKRIITRRRRPLHFANLILTTTSRSSPKPKPKSKGKRQRRSRVNTSMPLIRKRRSERSVLIAGE
ncbi:hypothetical protein HanRHA438_Chr08g0339301 [Helianthus annuus]|nr:hypothetical protein HanIR_Chr08g0354321 [Helianthus annuus]KAJ0896862.1 hypothetical protein HanRHA438_Chr08g0339301 [Helianthus annuus]